MAATNRILPASALLWFALLVPVLRADDPATLKLAQTIPLPGVVGRLDHFTIDAAGGRLFLAARGNNTVEVIDLKQGKVTHTLRGLAEPQGILYVAESNRLYVANGRDGLLSIFDCTTFTLVNVVQFSGDADNVRYDAATRQIFVGYGEGVLGVVDAVTNDIVGQLLLSAHPESFQLEMQSGRIFVNVPAASTVEVIDRHGQGAPAAWTTRPDAANFPMALDEVNHRLLVACRTPACLLVFDTFSGKQIARLALHGDCDDLFIDDAHRWIYASCGEGFIDVFAQADASHYVPSAAIPTVPRARTCFFDGRQIFLAVPRRGSQDAEVRVYDVH